MVLILGVVTGCGGPDASPDAGSVSSASTTTSTTPANVYEQQRAAGVTRLLDELTETITSGNVREVGVLLDDTATPGVQEQMGHRHRELPSP